MRPGGVGVRRRLAAVAGLLTGGLVSVLAGAAGAEPGPRDWLERMDHGVHALNYEGTVVHTHRGGTTVLHLVHRVEAGKVTERIVAQNDESGREMLRDDQQFTWIFPDRRSVFVAGAGRGAHGPDYRAAAEPYYQVALTPSSHIAGREVQGLAIRPTDPWRYGYRLWLDRETGVPLRTQLVDEQGEVVEQLLFTSVSIAGRIPPSALKPDHLRNDFAYQSVSTADAPPASAAREAWLARHLPPGFRLVATSPADGPAYRQFVYSDGLATVSVFVEPAVAASEQAEGHSRIGAASVYTLTADGYMVTAIGEVPERTVQTIAASSTTDAAPHGR